jgi:AraC-like DNA-binding protein
VLNERMRRAASLLVSSGAAVTKVSHDCGFDDPNYFVKAFRKSYGASPTEFRTTGMYLGRRAVTANVRRLPPAATLC